MRAVTLDFYNTLVHHRYGGGRGRRFQDYLREVGLTADPWEHRVLYDVFEHYATAYDPGLSEPAKEAFWIEFTRRLFERTSVRGPRADALVTHAPAIRRIMGPAAFAPFDDALPVLRCLKRADLRVGVVSDWQRGLAHFCDELGLGAHLDAVVASGEAGHEKPDPRLFDLARRRLGLDAREILHVGDGLQDVEGACAAGFAAALLVRGGPPARVAVPVLTDLWQLLPLVGVRPADGGD